MNDILKTLVENLAAQDAASTRDPIFLVQQKRLVDGLNPSMSVEGDPEGDLLPTRLLGHHTNPARGVAVVWEYVTAHFTRAAAERYIAENAHRMVAPRVYVDSQYRCHEWNAVRALLLAARDKPDALERFVRDILTP